METASCNHDLAAACADELVSAADLLPPTANNDLLLLVIPGYTLECLDESTPAIMGVSGRGGVWGPLQLGAMSVRHVHLLHPCPLHSQLRPHSHRRSTATFQWRLHPDCEVNDSTVGELVSQFASGGWPLLRNAVPCCLYVTAHTAIVRNAMQCAGGTVLHSLFTPGSRLQHQAL